MKGYLYGFGAVVCVCAPSADLLLSRYRLSYSRIVSLAFNPLLRYYVVATCRVPIYLPVDRDSYMNRHA